MKEGNDMIRSSDILKAKILIVDDQAANVLVLERMLQGAGYTSVPSTKDPLEVQGLHLKNRYDLILLDLALMKVGVPRTSMRPMRTWIGAGMVSAGLWISLNRDNANLSPGSETAGLTSTGAEKPSFISSRATQC